VSRTVDGVYQCVVKNEFKSVKSSPAQLTVLYFDHVILENSPRLTLEVGRKGVIDCKAEAVPPPNELLLSLGNVPFLSSRNASLDGSSLGTVTVKRLQHLRFEFRTSREWNGTVTCFGESEVGSDEDTMIIIVQTPPGPPESCASEAYPYSVSYSFQLGDDGQSPPITHVTLSCYKVSRDGELDTSGVYNQTTRKFDSPNCTIDVLSGLIPGTEYHCRLYARNSVGESQPSDSFDISTKNAGPATPVLDGLATDRTEESLQVHWNVDYLGGQPITYTVKFGTDRNSLDRSESKGPTTEVQGSHELTRLTRGTRYFVQIVAGNELGNNESTIRSYTTLCIPPTPSDVRVSTDEVDEPHTSIRILVSLPEDTYCGAIANYIVKDSSGSNWPFTTIATMQDQDVVLLVSGLAAETTYTLTVSFNNTNGTVSSASNSVTFTTSEIALPTEPIRDGQLIIDDICVIYNMLCHFSDDDDDDDDVLKPKLFPTVNVQ
jgi:hypothetical protein